MKGKNYLSNKKKPVLSDQLIAPPKNTSSKTPVKALISNSAKKDHFYIRKINEIIVRIAK